MKHSAESERILLNLDPPFPTHGEAANPNPKTVLLVKLRLANRRQSLLVAPMNIKFIDGVLTDEKRTALVIEPPLLDKDVIAECVRHLGEGTVTVDDSGVIFVDADKSTADFVKILDDTLQCCETVVKKRRQEKEDAHNQLLARLKNQTGLAIKGEKKPKGDY